MPKGTRVERCVKKVSKTYNKGAAIAICQKATKQNYRTGKQIKKKVAKNTKKKR